MSQPGLAQFALPILDPHRLESLAVCILFFNSSLGIANLFLSQPSNVQTFKPANVFCPIPFLFTLFQTLLHSPKSQLFCFQAIPNSFTKTPGGGRISCPSTRIKIKPQTANSVVQSARCSHRDPNARQCRTLALDARSGLCPRHLAQLQHELAADHFAHLTTRCHFFQTAQGINYSLMNLYQLLAQNRISPRRAAVLAYISSLLLRTLPA